MPPWVVVAAPERIAGILEARLFVGDFAVMTLFVVESAGEDYLRTIPGDLTVGDESGFEVRQRGDSATGFSWAQNVQVSPDSHCGAGVGDGVGLSPGIDAGLTVEVAADLVIALDEDDCLRLAGDWRLGRHCFDGSSGRFRDRRDLQQASLEQGFAGDEADAVERMLSLGCPQGIERLR